MVIVIVEEGEGVLVVFVVVLQGPCEGGAEPSHGDPNKSRWQSFHCRA